MNPIENLKITKFFDVKTPVGLVKRGESLDNYSIGVDLYVPKFTDEFVKALCEANKLYNLEPLISDEYNIDFYDINKIPNDIIASINKATGTLIIHKQLQIPTGIGMIIPPNYWCEVRTKSSNFQNYWTEVHGTVDMNYTYGVGVQIIPTKPFIKIAEDQKFAQLVMHEAVPICNIEEVPNNEWEELEEVKMRRQKRTGGFGHTGKFDK